MSERPDAVSGRKGCRSTTFSDVKIAFAADGALSLSDAPITLIWDAGIIQRLDG